MIKLLVFFLFETKERLIFKKISDEFLESCKKPKRITMCVKYLMCEK